MVENFRVHHLSAANNQPLTPKLSIIAGCGYHFVLLLSVRLGSVALVLILSGLRSHIGKCCVDCHMHCSGV